MISDRVRGSETCDCTTSRHYRPRFRRMILFRYRQSSQRPRYQL